MKEILSNAKEKQDLNYLIKFLEIFLCKKYINQEESENKFPKIVNLPIKQLQPVNSVIRKPNNREKILNVNLDKSKNKELGKIQNSNSVMDNSRKDIRFKNNSKNLKYSKVNYLLCILNKIEKKYNLSKEQMKVVFEEYCSLFSNKKPDSLFSNSTNDMISKYLEGISLEILINKFIFLSKFKNEMKYRILSSLGLSNDFSTIGICSFTKLYCLLNKHNIPKQYVSDFWIKV